MWLRTVSPASQGSRVVVFFWPLVPPTGASVRCSSGSPERNVWKIRPPGQKKRDCQQRFLVQRPEILGQLANWQDYVSSRQVLLLIHLKGFIMSIDWEVWDANRCFWSRKNQSFSQNGKMRLNDASLKQFGVLGPCRDPEQEVLLPFPFIHICLHRWGCCSPPHCRGTYNTTSKCSNERQELWEAT